MEIYFIAAALFVMLALRVPVAVSLAVSAAIGLYSLDMPLLGAVQRCYSGTESFVLMAIPLFVLAGIIMERGGLSGRMVGFADALLGFSPGGLANVNIGASMLFGGISGSAVADSSALGAILIPEMAKRGYGREYAAAVTAASSPIGMIIPPSIPMILWSFVSSESLGALFLAGIIPGILVGIGLMAVSTCVCVKRGFQPRGGRFDPGLLRRTAADGAVSLLAPAIIIGGIMSGYFTATESAVVAVAYSLAATGLWYRQLPWRSLPEILVRAGKTSASVMFIIGAASSFSWVLTIYRVPQTLGRAILDLSGSPDMFMLLASGLLFALGMFLDTSTIILLIGPIIAPMVGVLGINPLQAGIIFMLVLATGLITPPLGLCLFVVSSLSGVRLEKVAWECVPFVAVMLALALLIWFVPGLAVWIPGLSL